MRTLKINRNNTPNKISNIKYEVVDEVKDGGKMVYTFKSFGQHNLKDGDKIILRKEFVDKFDSYGNLIEANFTDRVNKHQYTGSTQKIMPVTVIDDRYFAITFDEYVLAEVENYALPNEPALLHFTKMRPETLVNDTHYFTFKSSGIIYEGHCSDIWDDDEMLNAEDLSADTIVIDKVLPNIIDDGFIFVKNTWHTKCILAIDPETKMETVVDTIAFDSSNIEFYETESFLTATIPLFCNVEFKVLDNATVAENYFNDIVSQIVPKTIDYEKRQFSPEIKNNSTYIVPAQEIEFNLHFRERTDFTIGNRFAISDENSVWNGFAVNTDSDFSIYRKNSIIGADYADNLGCLGFTEDDIKYQKPKVKKSFIRLMFYSTPNFHDKELLFYSTIFLDTNTLYQKYSQIINEGLTDIFDGNRNDKNLRLDATFSVKNKYDSAKSSEGFYLYLFPDDVTENGETTIYMKVEFNHAGYGQTIPMILPRGIDDSGEEYPLDVIDDGFLTTVISFGEDGMMDNNFEAFNRASMIPVNIRYDERTKKYRYHFPWFKNKKDSKITINLWEPRMRAIL